VRHSSVPVLSPSYQLLTDVSQENADEPMTGFEARQIWKMREENMGLREQNVELREKVLQTQSHDSVEADQLDLQPPLRSARRCASYSGSTFPSARGVAPSSDAPSQVAMQTVNSRVASSAAPSASTPTGASSPHIVPRTLQRPVGPRLPVRMGNSAYVGPRTALQPQVGRVVALPQQSRGASRCASPTPRAFAAAVSR